MERPQVALVLKRDGLGRVELVDGPSGPLVRRVACGGRLPGSRRVARLLLRRERRALERLAGLDGVPRLSPRADYATAPGADGAAPDPRDVLLREWLPGTPLWAAERIPQDFFGRLESLARAVHARGVCHNDLHKEPNVLVGDDGAPALVDFQLASVHPRGGRLFASRAREDLRHVAKHAVRYLTRGGAAPAPACHPCHPLSGGELPRPGRRSLVARAWMRLVKPVYNLVTRRLLRARDGEPRRPPEGPWPRWDPPSA